MAIQNVGIRLSVDGARKAEADLRGVSGGIEKIGVSAASVRNLLGGLAGAFAGFVSVRAVMQASDAVTALNNQLKLATGSASSAAAAYSSLFEIAQRSRVSFTELGGTFASITRATQEMGLSQQQVLEVTESIANAVTVSGASAQASQAALMQLSQGLASGVLRGEELNSVMEQTPRLARALADGLGVPIGKLREMGKAGELTAEQVIGALRSQNSVLARELGQSTVTMGQAFTQLQNAAVDATGKLDDTTGASQSLAKAIQGVAVGVQTLGDALAEHAGTIKTTFGAIAGAATVAGLASVAANIGKIRIAFLALAATLAANPVTLALLGIGAVAGSMVANQKDRQESLRAQLEATNRVLADANISEERRNRLIQRRLNLEKEILGLHSTSTAGAGRGFVNPGDEAVGRAARGVTIDDKTVKAHAKAMEEFAKAAASSQAKVLGLSAAQTKLREIMADPTWATMSQEMREQVIQAAKLAGATEKQAGATEANRKAAKAAAEEAKRNRKEITEAIAKDAGEVGKEYARAIKDFGGVASEAAAKSEELTKSQSRLREVMADPTWSRFSRQQQEQTIAAASAAQAAEDWAKAQEVARKSMADAADELKDYNDAQRNVVADSVAEATAAEESLRNYGLLRSEVEQLKLAKLEEARESAALAGEDVSNIEKRIAAQRRLVDAIKGAEVREASEEAAQHAADEWRKATDQINQSLTDSLMRGFESGKGFARSLRDAVVNMFKTMVLRPVIQAIVQPIAGPIAQGISGVLGGGGAGGLGSMVGSLFGAGGLGGSLAAGAGWMTGATTFGGSLAAAGSLLGSGTMGGLMSGLGMAAGALGPIALGAMALNSIFGGRRGGPKVDGHAGFTASNIGVMSGDRSLSPMIATQVQQLQAQYAQIARALGGDAGAIRFGMGVTTDPRGTAPSFLDITGIDRSGGTAINLVSTSVGRSNEELQAAIAQFVATATIEGLKRSDLAPQYRAFLDTVASGASTEVKQAAVQTLAEVQKFTSAVRSMGSQFGYVADMSVEARKRIIDLAGGIDTLASGLTSYASNFLSAEEQRQAMARSLSQTLNANGINDTADQLLQWDRQRIRKFIDRLDLQTAVGQRAFAAIMGNMDSVVAMVEANERLWDDQAAAARAEADAARQAAEEVQRLQDEAARFSDAVKGVSQTLGDEVERLRGAAGTGKQGLSALWAQFGTATAQARSGNLDAAGTLAGLSQSIEDAVRETASSRTEVAAVQDRLATSLTSTMGALDRLVGPSTSSPSVPSATPASGAAPSASSGADPLRAIKDMAEQTMLQQRQINALMSKFTNTITRWDIDGLPETREIA